MVSTKRRQGVGVHIYYAKAMPLTSLLEGGNVTLPESFGCLDAVDHKVVQFDELYYVDPCTRCRCKKELEHQLCHQIYCAPPETCPSGAFYKKTHLSCCDVCVDLDATKSEDMYLRLSIIAVSVVLVAVLFALALCRIRKGRRKFFSTRLFRWFRGGNLRGEDEVDGRPLSSMYATYRASCGFSSGSVVVHGLQPPPPYSVAVASPRECPVVLSDTERQGRGPDRVGSQPRRSSRISARNEGEHSDNRLSVVSPEQQTVAVVLPPPYAHNGTVVPRSSSATRPFGHLGDDVSISTLSSGPRRPEDGVSEDDGDVSSHMDDVSSTSNDDDDCCSTSSSSHCSCSICTEADRLSVDCIRSDPVAQELPEEAGRPPNPTPNAASQQELSKDVFARLCRECNDIVQSRLHSSTRTTPATLGRNVARHSDTPSCSNADNTPTNLDGTVRSGSTKLAGGKTSKCRKKLAKLLAASPRTKSRKSQRGRSSGRRARDRASSSTLQQQVLSSRETQI